MGSEPLLDLLSGNGVVLPRIVQHNDGRGWRDVHRDDGTGELDWPATKKGRYRVLLDITAISTVSMTPAPEKHPSDA